MILLWPHFPEVVSEAVTSLTDRLTGANAQQRIALNPQPMQGLSFQWGLGGVEAGAAEALYRSNPLGDWYVPFWPDALLVGALSAGVTSIACDASQRDYRPGGFVAVLDDFGNAEVAPLVSADASGITIGSGLVNDYSAAWVAPALVGHAPDGLFVTRTDSHFQTASISFRIRETADLGASTYDTFEGDPVLHDRSYMTDQLESYISQPSAQIGSGLGQIASEPTLDYIANTSAVRFEDTGAAARFQRRQWIWHLRGGQKAFWLPTWNSDLSLVADIGASDTEITVVTHAGLSSVVGRSVMIELADNTRFYRRVSSVSQGSTTSALTINASLGQAVSETEVRVLCYLNRVVAATDTVEIQHTGNHHSAFTLPVSGVPE